MKAILIALIMLTTAHTSETTCYTMDEWTFCDSRPDVWEETAREEARERQEEHYERMEEHAANAAFAAE